MCSTPNLNSWFPPSQSGLYQLTVPFVCQRCSWLRCPDVNDEPVCTPVTRSVVEILLSVPGKKYWFVKFRHPPVRTEKTSVLPRVPCHSALGVQTWTRCCVSVSQEISRL